MFRKHLLLDEMGAGGGDAGGAPAGAATSTPVSTTSSGASSGSQQTSSPATKADRSVFGDSESQKANGQSQGAVDGAEASPDSDLIDVKIGSVQAKLQKHVAESVKNLERGAQAAMRETARLRQELQTRMEREKLIDPKNPWSRLAAEGLKDDDIDNLALERLEKKAALLKMDPRERELMEREERVKKFETAQETREREEREQAQQAEHTQHVTAYDKEITEAFKTVGLPKNPFYVGQIAAEMLRGHRASKADPTVAPLTAAEAAAKIKSRWDSESTGYLKTLPTERILELLGDDKRREIREFELRQLRGDTGAPSSKGSAPQRPAAAASEQNSNRPLTQAEWDERYRGIPQG